MILKPAQNDDGHRDKHGLCDEQFLEVEIIAVSSGRCSCCCPSDLSFELFNELAECRVTLHAALDKSDRIDNG